MSVDNPVRLLDATDDLNGVRRAVAVSQLNSTVK